MMDTTSPLARWFSRWLRAAIVASAVIATCVATPALTQNKMHSEATTRLFESIEENNFRGAKINAIGGGDLEAVNSQGLTPIALAIEKGHFDIVFYLLAYRDKISTAKSSSEKGKQAAAAPLTAPPAPQPTPEIPPPAKLTRDTPVSAVAGVYKPPPGSAPWSATVVTTDPPTPELEPIPVLQGPSPFDAESRPPGSGLTIIGEIRSLNEPGPEEPFEQPEEVETFETVVIAAPPAPEADPAPEITPEDPIDNAPSDIADPVAANTVQTAINVVPPIPDPDPAPQQVAQAPSPFDADSRAPGSGLTIIGEVRTTADPEPETAVEEFVETLSDEPAPEVTEPSPLFDNPVEPPAPEPAPVLQAAAPVEPEPRVETVSTTRIKPQPVPQIQVQPTAAQKNPPPERKLIPIETTLPGKPKDDQGFFGKILSIFSIGDDEPDTRQVAHNRVVQPMPPKLSSDQPAAQNGEGDNGWAVRKIEKTARASYPEKAALPTRDRSGEPLATLQNINLALLRNRGLGLPSPKAKSTEFQKSCVAKKSGSVAFCIVGLEWPIDVANLFAASTVLYEGTKAIVRYDEGAATYYHTLFPTKSFAGIVKYFTARYGPPSKSIERSIAPLAAPRISNPTVIWHSIAPVTKLLTTLEVRTFDDARGGFPDTQRGVALLYHEWSQPVFPHISTVELMMLSARQQR